MNNGYPTSQDEVDLFDRSDLRRHGHVKNASVQDSIIGVVTGIEGGFQSFEKGKVGDNVKDCGKSSQDSEGMEGAEDLRVGAQGGILTTVRIEQSYV